MCQLIYLKIKLSILLVVLSLNFLIAQDTHITTNLQQEIFFSYGLGSIPNIRNYPVFSKVENYDFSNTRALTIGYIFHKTSRWSYGIEGVFEQYKETFLPTEDVIKCHHFTIMAKTDFRWVKKTNFQLYSSIAAGGTYIIDMEQTNLEKEKSKSFSYAYQVSPLGLRLGDKLGVFLEVGLGWTGFFVFGISSKF